MAHAEKYNSIAAQAMIEHYQRRAEIERDYHRENVDNSRTYLNYNLRSEIDPKIAIKNAHNLTQKTTGKKVRKDAIVMFDWIVTKPVEVKAEDERNFFEIVLDFEEKRYGKNNIVGGYVHMDETTPHMHTPIVPLKDDRLCAKQILNRNDLVSFHKDLNTYVDEALGYHVSIQLDDAQRGKKQLSNLNQDDYVRAVKVLENQQQEIEQKQDILESLNDDISRAEKNLESSKRSNDLKQAELNDLEQQLSELLGYSNGSGGSLIAEAEAFCQKNGI